MTNSYLETYSGDAMGNLRNSATAIALALILGSLFDSRANAQEPDAAVQQGDDIESIIVTAQRRAQTLIEVPMSVTAIAGDELETKGMTGFLDYAVSVPSLSFGFNGAEARGSRDTIAIRGVSGTDTTGYYVNDTPIPYGIDPHLIDVQRIEVLRGPQGTLYGSGSMGGTIKIISEKPDTDDFSARLNTGLSYTKDGGVNSEISGVANLPLSEDKVGARVSAYYEGQSGIYDRVFGEQLPYYPEAPVPALSGIDKNIDSSTSYGGHIEAVWKPVSDLEIAPTVFWQRTIEDGATQADSDPDQTDQFRAYDIQEPFEDRHVLANLTIRYAFPFADFVSSTSTFNRKWKETEDITEIIDLLLRENYANPAAPPYPMPIFNSREQDRFAQELRLSGTAGQIDWLLGAFYQTVDTSRFAIIFPEGMAANPDYVDFGVNDNLFISHDAFDTTEKAVFTDLTWRLTDQFDVSAGVRLFDNETESARDSSGLLDAGVLYSGRKSTETGNTPRVSARYMLNDETAIYATAAKGFRLGGTNTPLPTTCDADLAELGISSPDTFGSDSLWSYEVGTKARALDNKLDLKVSAFLIDWSDIQQDVRLPNCGFAFTSNVGKSEIRGFEVEAAYSLTDDLSLNIAISQNDSEVTDAGLAANAEKGDKLLNTPEWKFTASGEANFQLARRDAFFQLEYQFFGESWSTFNQDDPDNLRDPQPYLPRDDFQTVDARLGVQLDDVQLIFFVENALDEMANLGDARSIGLEFPGRRRLITNRPRTFGAMVRIDFY